MKAQKKMPSLDRAEWDFRKVADHDLEIATEWEYARSATEFCDFISAWLETQIQGHSIREHIHLFYNDPNHNGDAFFREAINDMAQMSLANNHSKEWHTAHTNIFSTMMGFPRTDFPASWTAMPPRKRHPRVRDEGCFYAYSYQTNFAKCAEMWRYAHIYDGEGNVKERLYLTLINFEANTENLIANFAKWVRAEAKKYPRKLGQPTQAPTYPLKCLSAYRLKQAGLTFADAQELLRKNKISDGGRLIPTYADPAGWTDAIKYAKARLKKLASSAD